MNAPEKDPALDNYRAIADAIATLFFPHAEVVLHDLRTQKIDYIANNLSKREIGDDAALEDMLSDDVSETQHWAVRKAQLGWSEDSQLEHAYCATAKVIRSRCCAST